MALNDRQKQKVLTEEAMLQYSKTLDIFDIMTKLRNESAATLKKLITVSDGQFIIKVAEKRVDMGKLVGALPRHMLACLDQREPRRWTAELTYAPGSVGARSWRQYLAHCFGLLLAFFEIAPKFSRLDQLLRESERREEMKDLIIYTLLSNALPQEVFSEADAAEDAGGAAGRRGEPLSPAEDLARGQMCARAVLLLPPVLGKKGGDEDVDWETISHHVTTHSMGLAFIPAIFDATRSLLKSLRAMLPAAAADPESDMDGAPHTELAWSCDVMLEAVGLLVAVPHFYKAVAKHGPTFRAPLTLLFEALSVLRPTAPGAAAVRVEDMGRCGPPLLRIAARGLAIMNTLEYEEEPSFLDVINSRAEVKDIAWDVVDAAFDHFESALLRELPPPSELQGPPDINGMEWEGLVELGALRCAEILTDDSNFRERLMARVAAAAAAALSLDNASFQSLWCGGAAARHLHKDDTEVLTIAPQQAGLVESFQAVVAKSNLLTAKQKALLVQQGAGKGPSKAGAKALEPQSLIEPHVRERAGYLFKNLGNLNCFNTEVTNAYESGHFQRLLIEELTKKGSARQGFQNITSLSRYVLRELPDPAIIAEQDKELVSNLRKGVQNAIQGVDDAGTGGGAGGAGAAEGDAEGAAEGAAERAAGVAAGGGAKRAAEGAAGVEGGGEATPSKKQKVEGARKHVLGPE